MFFRIGMQPVQPVIHLGAGVGFPSSYIIPLSPKLGIHLLPASIKPAQVSQMKHAAWPTTGLSKSDKCSCVGLIGYFRQE